MRVARLPLYFLLLLLLSGCAAHQTHRGQSLLSPEQARTVFQQGEAAYQLGLYHESHAAFMAAEAAGHLPGPSLINAGASLLAMRQSAQALSLLERASREHPTSAAAWYNYGLALYGTGTFDGAIRALRRSIELDPANADVWTALGAAFVSMRQPGVAVDQFSRALALAPDDTAIKSTILSGRAGAYLDATLHTEAERDYLAVLELGNDPAIAHMGLGEVYLARRQCSRADEQFSRAIELSPGNSLAYYNRGIAHRQCGGYEKAIDDFSRALAFDPEWSEALVMRGDTHLLRRNTEQGCKDLLAACAMGNCDRLHAVRAAGVCPR